MPQPFTLRVPDSDIADLRERLARTRFPDSAPGEPWLYGTDVDYLRSLVDTWRGPFDWRAQEARLNAFPQFKVTRPDYRPPFSACPGKGAQSDAAPVDARLAGIRVRVPGLHSPPHRSGELRRRSGGRFHGRRAVAAGLWALVQAWAETVRRRGTGGLFRGPHDRHARLQALRCAGRRLGRHHRRAHGLRACGQADRHSRQFSSRPPRARADQKSDSRRARFSRSAQSLAQRGRPAMRRFKARAHKP